jgi:hypothetical protein
VGCYNLNRHEKILVENIVQGSINVGGILFLRYHPLQETPLLIVVSPVQGFGIYPIYVNVM